MRQTKGAQLTEEEIGAIVAVLYAKRRGSRLHSVDDRPLAGGWKSYYRVMRQPLFPGREAWRRR